MEDPPLLPGHGEKCIHVVSSPALTSLTHPVVMWRGQETFGLHFNSQFSSVAQSCPTLWDPMNSSTPDLPVHHQHLEFTQTHVHRVSDAIQPSHPLSSPSPPALNPSQHHSLPMSQLFVWGGQSTRVSPLASFPPNKSQGWSPSKWIGWISLQSKGLSRVLMKLMKTPSHFVIRPEV